MGSKILCYGDSNTYGYDPRSYLGGRYPETVRWTALLKKQGWKVLNQGENGRSIPHREREVSAVNQMIGQLSPDVMIIMLGSNDLLQAPNLSAEDCALRMERFIQMLLPQDQSRRFLLIAPPPMALGAWVSDEAILTASKHLGEHYQTVARRVGIDFADAGDWDVALAFDGVHFSEAGHLSFARGMDQVLRRMALKPNQED